MALAIKTLKSFWIGSACVIAVTLGVAIFFGFSGKASTSGKAIADQPAPVISSPPPLTPLLNRNSERTSARAPGQGLTNIDEDVIETWLERSKSDPLFHEFAEWVNEASRGNAIVMEEGGIRLAERRRE